MTISLLQILQLVFPGVWDEYSTLYKNNWCMQ